ncbi:hypothetical protein SLS58_003006 [Diplodia intermedia]|uniref:Uncharacterized protein n=1 Tax=Diplodia intermedia TaxID=856260 RepID=A0ABR3TXF6_9PEZI
MPIVTVPPRAALSRAILNVPSRHSALLHHRSYHSSRLPLDNHHVLVTGGSRGIGKAIASRFACLGASTTIIGRNADTLQSAVRELVSHQGADDTTRTHGYVAGDVSSKGFWEMLARSLVLRTVLSPSADSFCSQHSQPRQEKFNPAPVTIIVNAAGVTHNALLVRQSAVATEDVVQTNLMGTMWACKLMGKVLMKSAARARGDANKQDQETAAAASKDEGGEFLRGGVSIVNVSSLLAVQGGMGSAAYAARLTRALAGEMGPLGVRVNAIVPGYVETDMTSGKSTHESRMVQVTCHSHGNISHFRLNPLVPLAVSHKTRLQ